jgi:hypothetical protein
MIRTWILILVLGGFLIVALIYGLGGWIRLGDVEMGWHGWAALIGGAVGTLAVGGGLMALVFFSSRHGYDDAQHDPETFRRPPEPRDTDDDTHWP